MHTTMFTKIITGSALIAATLVSGSANAAPESVKTMKLVDFPASGSQQGKYASAWLETRSRSCGIPNSDTPDCYEGRAVLSGKVLNAVMDAVTASASATHHLWPQDMWTWAYNLKVFGTTITSRVGGIATSQVVANGIVGQPAIDDRRR